MACCDIFEVFDEENNLIKEYDHWKVLVSNRTRTLGNSIVVLKRHIENFSEITDEEALDYAKVVRELETALKKSFNYDKINWLMLMMRDKHVHFHVIPRYREPKNFAGKEWRDTFNGDPLTMERAEFTQEILNQIKEEIKSKLE